MKSVSTPGTVSALKSMQQDFEWYPTTSKQLLMIKLRLLRLFPSQEPALLDVGAGDGRALMTLTAGRRYAIEKSTHLISLLDSSIVPVGTDIYEQSLLDKKVDVIFSNPIYSDFVSWVEKIILEGNATFGFLVIPRRWRKSAKIKAALRTRHATAKTIYTSDFHTGDRQARAIVDVVFIDYRKVTKYETRFKTYTDKTALVPFNVWYGANFGTAPASSLTTDWEKSQASKQSLKSKMKNAVIEQGGLVKNMESFYMAEMEHLISNYKSLSNLDPDLLSELNVSTDQLREGLQLKIASKKDVYWRELVDNLPSITSRLCSKPRKTLLDSVFEHTSIDFTASNAHAMAIWMINHANKYIDSQLIGMVEDLTSAANVVLYKSNYQTFKRENWRYNQVKNELKNYKLDYRIVLESPSKNILDDLLTIANNLGVAACKHNPSDLITSEKMGSL